MYTRTSTTLRGRRGTMAVTIPIRTVQNDVCIFCCVYQRFVCTRTSTTLRGRRGTMAVTIPAPVSRPRRESTDVLRGQILLWW